MKPILSSLMEKNRYVVFQVDSKDKLTHAEVKKAITNSVLSFLGELETAKSGFLVMNDFKQNKGIVKTNPKYVDKIMASLALVKSADTKKIKIKTIKVSGILKKAKEVFQ